VNVLRARRSLRSFLPALALFAATIAPDCHAQETLQVDLPEAATTGELKTFADLAIAPYDNLLADIKFLGTLAGKPELSQMVEGGLALFTQGKGANALDKDKPWGLIVQTDGNALLPVVCLPVKNLDDLVGIAVAYGAQVNDGDDGAKELVLPNEQSLFVKHADGFAFLSTSTAALAKAPKTPGQSFGKLLTDYDIAAKIIVKNVPENYRQFAMQAMKAGMQQQLVQKDDESEEEFEMRRQMAEAQLSQMEQMFTEFDSLTVGWSVDAEQQKTFLDFAYFVKADSKLARQLKAYEDTRTSFSGFYKPDVAGTVTFAMNGDPSLFEEKDLAQFEAMMESTRQQMNKAIDDYEGLADEPEVRAAYKEAAGELINVFGETMRTGKMDGGASLDLRQDSLTAVAGLYVKDSTKLEEGLKKLHEAAKQKKDSKVREVKWNADSHAGVAFHTFSVEVPAELEAPRRMLGEQADIAVGIGKEAVYVAIGRDNLDAVKKAIDASAAEPNKEVPPFELAVSLGPIIDVVAADMPDSDEKKTVEAVAEMLRNEAQGRDHVRMVGQLVPNGLRYRLEAEEGVLRAIGKGAAEAQRRQMEALQQQR
jgi:hypothetical protein